MKFKVYIVIVIIILLLVWSVFVYKKNISLQELKIDSLQVGKNSVSLLISTNSSSKNFWGYNYKLDNRKLYINIFELSFLNPFSINNEIVFNEERGYDDYDEIYIQSGSQSKLIWNAQIND